MSAGTKIEWADHTFNPWWGCQKVSDGCANCYADTFAKRLGKSSLWGPGHGIRDFGEKHWNEPRRWNRKAAQRGVRERVFCASMADVFEGHPDSRPLLERLWPLIAETPHLQWMLLTKRPENLANLLPREIAARVWLGVSVENQEAAETRIPLLLQTPAAVRFVSCEPLLGPVDFDLPQSNEDGDEWFASCLKGPHSLDWVIAGGESGPKARPMHPDWARSLRDQCTAAGVPFHFKQWGAWAPWGRYEGEDGRWDTFVNLDGSVGDFAQSEEGPITNWSENLRDGWHVAVRVGKKAAGRELDGRTWDEFPELTATEIG